MWVRKLEWGNYNIHQSISRGVACRAKSKKQKAKSKKLKLKSVRYIRWSRVTLVVYPPPPHSNLELQRRKRQIVLAFTPPAPNYICALTTRHNRTCAWVESCLRPSHGACCLQGILPPPCVLCMQWMCAVFSEQQQVLWVPNTSGQPLASHGVQSNSRKKERQ